VEYGKPIGRRWRSKTSELEIPPSFPHTIRTLPIYKPTHSIDCTRIRSVWAVAITVTVNWNAPRQVGALEPIRSTTRPCIHVLLQCRPIYIPQLASSDLSEQSPSPSHSHLLGMHLAKLAHWNWSDVQFVEAALVVDWVVPIPERNAHEPIYRSNVAYIYIYI